MLWWPVEGRSLLSPAEGRSAEGRFAWAKATGNHCKKWPFLHVPLTHRFYNHTLQWLKNNPQKLPVRESNPGLPRDRRGY